ncbi:MAG: SRPBCC family protein [Gemmatimonadaceae bacterium]
MTSDTITDRIEKQVRLESPRSRVWRALTDAREFGTWFGVALQGAFMAGKPIRGQITTPGYEHVPFEAIVDRIEPERFFSFRWRPYAIDPAVDYSAEPRTLVEFTLEDADGGTLLTVVESGFDGIPASRRVKAFEMNARGWAAQCVRIQNYLVKNDAQAPLA